MAKSYTGVKVINTSSDTIDSLFKNKKLDLAKEDEGIFSLDSTKLYPNEFVVLKCVGNSKQSALTRCINGTLLPIKANCKNIKPKNKEQIMALNILTDDSIPIVILTGRAGVGKTLLTLAAALTKIDTGEYERIILTKPMSWVGKYGLGALPGDVDEKFTPYLENYMCNIECLTEMKRGSVQHLLNQYRIEMIPLQLIRGASWHRTFVIADEVQILNYQEMVTLGTRLGEGSKLIIMGDLTQRDEKIAKEKTGIYKLVNNEMAKKSPLLASIELIKCERSPASELFADIFGAI